MKLFWPLEPNPREFTGGVRSGRALELYMLLNLSEPKEPNLVNSLGLALWSYICLVLLLKVLVWLYWPLEPNPREFTGGCVLEVLWSFIFRKP